MFRLTCIISMVLLWGCRPEVDVYAPERETHIVYGVLDPQVDTQYVRLAQAFQSDGDALAYAEENDLSLGGYIVTIEGNGKLYQSTEIEVDRGPGDFFGRQTVYQFVTAGADRLVERETYTLNIRKPDTPDFLITASTLIPSEPDLVQPSTPVFSPLQGSYALPVINFSKDFTILTRDNTGVGFEARVYLDYEQNGEIKTAQWGPLTVEREPSGCEANFEAGQMCLNIPDGAVGLAILDQIDYGAGPVVHHDTTRVARSLAELSRVVRVEVTAIDYHLTRFLYANSSFGFGLNLLQDKPELTNIEGGDAGIFGSINRGSRWVMMDGCSKFEAGLIPVPPANCPR